MSSIKLDTSILAEKYDQLSDPQFHNGKLLIEELQVKNGHQVLDIGSGTGRLAEYVAKTVGKKGKVTGIDPSPHRVKVASSKAKPPLNLSFEVGSGDDLSRFKEKSVDRVYLNAVLGWISDKKSAFSEIHRVLKPRGKLGLTHASTDIQRAFFTYRQVADRLLKKEPYASAVKSEEETPRPHPISTDELVLLLINSGFEDIKLNLKKYTRYFPTAREYLDLIEASSFGNFLTNVPEKLRVQFRSDLEKELENNKTEKGIEFTNYTLFATARNNGWKDDNDS